MKLDAVAEETGPGRWLATAAGCTGDGATEEEALAGLRATVFRSCRQHGNVIYGPTVAYVAPVGSDRWISLDEASAEYLKTFPVPGLTPAGSG